MPLAQSAPNADTNRSLQLCWAHCSKAVHAAVSPASEELPVRHAATEPPIAPLSGGGAVVLLSAAASCVAASITGTVPSLPGPASVLATGLLSSEPHASKVAATTEPEITSTDQVLRMLTKQR